MFQLRTLGDLVFYLFICTLVAAMGVLLLLLPVEPLPLDEAAYLRRDGVLDAVDIPIYSRGTPWVRFRLVDDPRWYERRANGLLTTAKSWRPGATRMAFHVLASELDRPEPRAYALRVDDGPAPSLFAEISELNRPSSPWGALLALFVGLSGYVVSYFWWRSQKRQGVR